MWLDRVGRGRVVEYLLQEEIFSGDVYVVESRRTR